MLLARAWHMPGIVPGTVPGTVERLDHQSVLFVQPTTRLRRKTSLSVACASSGSGGIPTRRKVVLESKKPTSTTTEVVIAPKTNHVGFRRSHELGLLSLLFVLSMALGGIISLAIISIPAAGAFRRLSASMDKLSKVVSEEVPGTLSSLKLSGLEINDLTQQLSTIRQKISGNRRRKN